MDKNTSLAFVLIGIVLIVWLYFFAPKPPEPTVKDEPKKETVEKPTELKRESTKEEVIKTKTPDVKVEKDEIVYTIETDDAIIELTNWGARIRRAFMKEYETWYSKNLPEDAPYYKKIVQLVNTDIEGGDFSVELMKKDGKLLSDKDLFYDLEYDIHQGDARVLSFIYKFSEKGILRKKYSINENDRYSFKCFIEFVEMNDIIGDLNYNVVWNTGINFVERNSADESNYSNASVYSGEEQVIVDASSPNEKIEKQFSGKIDWIGVRNKYFTALIAPNSPSSNGGAFIEGFQVLAPENGKKEFYSAGLKVPIENPNSHTDEYFIYIGPVEYDILKSYGKSFEKIVDFGSFFGLKFIIRPISEYLLLPLFKFLHTFIPNYGFVIIVFSLIIKLALYPLTKSSMASMKKMQMLQPKIAELKEKYKDDAQKMNKEMMKMYSTYGINPAGGCLPLLLQMPILIALWGLFNAAVEIRHQPFLFWIDNLSSPDVIFTLPFSLPLFGIREVSGLALALGATMFYQQKMTVKDPNQKAMVYIMPPMLTLLFMSFPSGLNLYYFMFNIFSMIQQYFYNKRHDNVELIPVQNPKKQQGFWGRMMEAAEKKAGSQRKAAKGKKIK